MGPVFDSVAPTHAERAETRPGDDLVASADVVMDRAFTVAGRPQDVWPWIVQLGKARAGWYFSRRVERLVPPNRRAVRHLDPRWQALGVGDVIPDYGGPSASFTVAALHAPEVLVYRSTRGRLNLSWSITLRALDDDPSSERTRVLLRLRLGPVKRRWLAGTVGGFFDLVTIAGMAAGLRERISATSR